MENGVVVKVIMEVVGKPREHVEETLNLINEQLQHKKGIKIRHQETFKPKEVDNLFSAFMELELQFESAPLLTAFCIEYMPSSIEIIEPLELDFSSAQLSNLLNDLLARLHQINLSVANKNAENQILRKNAEGLLKNIILLSLTKPKKIEEISKDIGIRPKELRPILEPFVKTGKIKKEKEIYSLIGSLYENG